MTEIDATRPIAGHSGQPTPLRTATICRTRLVLLGFLSDEPGRNEPDPIRSTRDVHDVEWFRIAVHRDDAVRVCKQLPHCSEGGLSVVGGWVERFDTIRPDHPIDGSCLKDNRIVIRFDPAGSTSHCNELGELL